MTQTLYWHDYETWGVNPAIDRPAQFAGLRTDEALNIIGDPLVIYCRPPDDILPNPEACLVTGIAPQHAEAEGLCEAEFMRAVLAELGTAGTCGVGYNTLRFDDEVTRFGAYRNFFDPYEREWKNGCSRWDIIDLVRACYALRPEGIEWPMVEGVPSFRLELLTQANGIGHESAHDALSDVHATIQMARLVLEKQPALYHHVFTSRGKKAVANLLDWQSRKPLLHVSSMFGAARGCASLVLPLAMHPTNKNAVIVVDLTVAPDWFSEPAEAIAERVFTRSEDLPEGVERIPLKLVHLNKCPILLPPNALTEKNAKRLNIDLQACEHHWRTYLKHDVTTLVQTAMSEQVFEPRMDPEQQLYEGFIPNGDRTLMQSLRAATPEKLEAKQFLFEDERLTAMVLRYKARNYPQTLTPEEARQWRVFCQARLREGEPGILSVSELKARIEQLDQTETLNKPKKIVLQQLYRWADELGKRYEIGKKCQW